MEENQYIKIQGRISRIFVNSINNLSSVFKKGVGWSWKTIKSDSFLYIVNEKKKKHPKQDRRHKRKRKRQFFKLRQGTEQSITSPTAQNISHILICYLGPHLCSSVILKDLLQAYSTNSLVFNSSLLLFHRSTLLTEIQRVISLNVYLTVFS